MKQHTVTTLPPSPDAERRARMIKYTVAMSIRVLCIFLMLFAQGWWLVVCAAGAIFLPYIAVVLANVGGGEQGLVERPGSIVPVGRAEAVGAADTSAAPSAAAEATPVASTAVAGDDGGTADAGSADADPAAGPERPEGER
jgi:predicted tellurium resistance membrane protein TerC